MFKIKNYFSYKDPIPDDLKSFLVYKFTCASSSSSYIGETCHHFKTRMDEHIKKDIKSHIFKHLYSTAACFDSHNSLCFKIIDKANSKFHLKIKEALHINWKKTKLKLTTKSFSSHPFTIASVPPPCPFSVFVLFVCVSLSSIIFIISDTYTKTLISDTYTTCFYHYTSVLLHLVTIHLLLHPFLSSIIFIISTLIIGIFYCLNYTSLLLYLIITHLVVDFIITM